MNLNQHLISKTPEADQYDSCLLKNSKFNSVKNNNDNETSSSKKIYCTCNNHEIFVNERVRQKIINESFMTKYETLFCLICFILLTKFTSILVFVYFLIKIKHRFNQNQQQQHVINSTQKLTSRLNILLIVIIRLIKSSSRFKTYILIFLFLPTLTCLAYQPPALNSSTKVTVETIDPNEIINNQFKSFDCNEENEKDRLKFDTKLFFELNMHETIINLWKSCFRENLFDNDLEYDDNKEFLKIDNIPFMSCARQILIEKVLYKLLNNFHNVVNTDILNRIQLVCQSNSEHILNNNNNNKEEIKVNLFDKLYLLSSYEHDLCGNIFRNSMKQTHLYNEVLKLNQIKNNKLIDFPNISKLLNNNNNDKKSIVSLRLKSKNVSAQHVETDNLEFKFRSNSHYVTTSTTQYNYLTLYNNPFISNVNSIATSRSTTSTTTTTTTIKNIKTSLKELNNCTLILLNTFLLAYKSSCENKDFHLSLSHYDCASNNFSVKSNCKLCQEAYGKWLCSTNIPYYENGTLAKPCQRFCFNVQNMCPFFRPMDDTFGAQPLFHCRNVVQVSEERPDGYEDDDEHYYEEDKTDEDKCYAECNENSKNETIETDLDIIFKQYLPTSTGTGTTQTNNSNFLLIDEWSRLTTSLLNLDLFLLINNRSSNSKSFNKNTRYSKSTECIFNSVSAVEESANLTSSLSSSSNKLKKTSLLLQAFILMNIINEILFLFFNSIQII